MMFFPLLFQIEAIFHKAVITTILHLLFDDSDVFQVCSSDSIQNSSLTAQESACERDDLASTHIFSSEPER